MEKYTRGEGKEEADSEEEGGVEQEEKGRRKAEILGSLFRLGDPLL